jgi:hypothetical protein
MMKQGLRQYRVEDPKPARKYKPIPNRGRVKGLSAACKKNQHSRCTSLSCTCIHHQNEHGKPIK